MDYWFNDKRSAEKACGSFAGLSAAPLCTVLHFRQRTPRYNITKRPVAVFKEKVDDYDDSEIGIDDIDLLMDAEEA